MTVVSQPAATHACEPPRYRPKGEWRTVRPPLAFMRPEDRPRAKPMPVPTAYPTGTVWLCSCGRGWVSKKGAHSGRNPNFGHGPDRWVPVSRCNFRIRRAIEAHKAQEDYCRAAEVVATWSPS